MIQLGLLVWLLGVRGLLALTPATTSRPYVTLGWSAVSWIEHYLVHGPGDVQGERIELDDEFTGFVLKAYRLDSRTGRRIVRRAFLSRAKGRSKSGLAAMLVCYEALGPCRFDHWAEAGEVSPWGYEYDEGEPVGRPVTYAEVLCVATEEGQAGNTYDAVLYMLSPDTCADELLEDYGALDAGLTRTNLPDKRGSIEPVSSGDSSKDGGKSTFIVADETHLWLLPRLKRLHGVMARNLMKRKLASGWMLETSTMYAAGEESVAEGTHAYAKSPAGRTGKLLFDHRQADPKWTEAKLAKRSNRLKALREAYGPAAEWMDLDELADAWNDPQVSHADWRRYWLNQPVPTEEPEPDVLAGWGAAALKIAQKRKPPKPAAIGLAVSIDGRFGSIAAAGVWEAEPELAGKVNVGAVARAPGTRWMVKEAKRIQRRYGCAVVLDGKGPGMAPLLKRLQAAGVDVTVATTDDWIEACGLMYEAVENDNAVTHQHTPELDAAVHALAWRNIGERRVFGRRAATSDIAMAEAGTLAAWVALTGANYDVLDSVG